MVRALSAFEVLRGSKECPPAFFSLSLKKIKQLQRVLASIRHSIARDTLHRHARF